MKYKQILIIILLFLWFNACKRQCSTLYLKNALLTTYDSLTDSGLY